MKSCALLPLAASCIALLYCASSTAIPISKQQELGSYEDITREINLVFPKEGKLAPVTRALQAGDIDRARNLLAPFLARMPNSTAALELDGTIKFNEGDLDGASESFQKALSISPNLLSTIISLGLVELARGNLREAQELLQKVAERQENNKVAHKYLARIAMHANDHAQAEKHYLAALQANPDDVELYNELGVLYLSTQRYLDAQKLLEPQVKDNVARDPGISLLLAQAYIKLNNIDGARKQLAAAKMSKEENSQIRILEAIADRAEGKLVTAVERLRLILKDDPGNILAHYQLGLTLAQSGEREQALEEMETAAQSLQNYSQIRVDIARLRLAGGEAEKAIAVLKPMTNEDSIQGPVALQLLSEAYSQTGRQDEARETARLATRRFPKWPAAWMRYADLEIKAGHLETAQKVLENGLDQLPDNDTLRFQLARLYQNRNMWSEAEIQYRRVLVTKPRNVGALNNLAMVLAEDETRRDEALQLARSALRLAPASPASEDTLGWILYLRGDFAKARHWLTSANNKLPGDPNVLCRLGIVFSAQGDIAIARTALEQCLPRATEPQLRKLAAAALSATR